MKIKLVGIKEVFSNDIGLVKEGEIKEVKEEIGKKLIETPYFEEVKKTEEIKKGGK